MQKRRDFCVCVFAKLYNGTSREKTTPVGVNIYNSRPVKWLFIAPLLQCRQEFIKVLTSSPEIAGKPCYQTFDKFIDRHREHPLIFFFFCPAGVHSGSTIQAIQGASHPGLSSQPASLVSAPFPVEDEQHSQPISQQGLHYLHSAYRVGKDAWFLIT